MQQWKAYKQVDRLNGLAVVEKTIRMMLVVASTSTLSVRADDSPSTAISLHRESFMKNIRRVTSFEFRGYMLNNMTLNVKSRIECDFLTTYVAFIAATR